MYGDIKKVFVCNFRFNCLYYRFIENEIGVKYVFWMV